MVLRILLVFLKTIEASRFYNDVYFFDLWRLVVLSKKGDILVKVRCFKCLTCKDSSDKHSGLGGL